MPGEKAGTPFLPPSIERHVVVDIFIVEIAFTVRELLRADYHPEVPITLGRLVPLPRAD